MDAPAGTTLGDVTLDELQLAARNHALPLEALRYPVTPVGLHYLLTHYDIPAVDPDSWRLEIGGSVERPLSLSLADLRARDAVTMPVTLECAGNGRARLDAAPAEPAVADRGGRERRVDRRAARRRCSPRPDCSDDAVELLFTGLDRGIEGGVEQFYERSLPRAEALGGDALLAYAVNGAPLPPQHGAPLRLVIAGWYGMAHVKWLASITALTEPFEGYQNKVSYRLYATRTTRACRSRGSCRARSRSRPGSRTSSRARASSTPARACSRAARGRAGRRSSASRSASTAARRWDDARRSASRPGERAWRGWSYEWDAAGRASTCSARARPTRAGNAQPLEPAWNLKGFANNAVERLSVTVR